MASGCVRVLRLRINHRAHTLAAAALRTQASRSGGPSSPADRTSPSSGRHGQARQHVWQASRHDLTAGEAQRVPGCSRGERAEAPDPGVLGEAANHLRDKRRLRCSGRILLSLNDATGRARTVEACRRDRVSHLRRAVVGSWLAAWMSVLIVTAAVRHTHGWRAPVDVRAARRRPVGDGTDNVSVELYEAMQP